MSIDTTPDGYIATADYSAPPPPVPADSMAAPPKTGPTTAPSLKDVIDEHLPDVGHDADALYTRVRNALHALIAKL